jgi:hypothetical protein
MSANTSAGQPLYGAPTVSVPVAEAAVFAIIAPPRPATMLEWACPSGSASTPEEFVIPEPIA